MESRTRREKKTRKKKTTTKELESKAEISGKFKLKHVESLTFKVIFGMPFTLKVHVILWIPEEILEKMIILHVHTKVWVTVLLASHTCTPQNCMLNPVRGCLHDTGVTFTLGRDHSGSPSWLYICLHDTTTKCHASASHPGVSSPRFLYRGENFTPVRNLATVSCKRETTTRFGVKSVCR